MDLEEVLKSGGKKSDLRYMYPIGSTSDGRKIEMPGLWPVVTGEHMLNMKDLIYKGFRFKGITTKIARDNTCWNMWHLHRRIARDFLAKIIDTIIDEGGYYVFPHMKLRASMYVGEMSKKRLKFFRRQGLYSTVDVQKTKFTCPQIEIKFDDNRILNLRFVRIEMKRFKRMVAKANQGISFQGNEWRSSDIAKMLVGRYKDVTEEQISAIGQYLMRRMIGLLSDEHCIKIKSSGQPETDITFRATHLTYFDQEEARAVYMGEEIARIKNQKHMQLRLGRHVDKSKIKRYQCKKHL